MLKLKTDYVKIISDREHHILSLVYPDGLRYVARFYTDDDAQYIQGIALDKLS